MNKLKVCGNDLESSTSEAVKTSADAQLEMAMERIEELENELSEKTKLVNELLLSKDELLNSNFRKLLVDQRTGAAGDKSTTSRHDENDESLASNGSRSLLSNVNRVTINDNSKLDTSSPNVSTSLGVEQAAVINQDINATLDSIQSKLASLIEYALSLN